MQRVHLDICFFFSSRRRHTRFSRDWSSDVCSSDLRALRRLVQSAGYTVETFASAREFLDSSPSGRTACLVLDVHLGGMSGFELSDRLAVDRAAIPIVFITAHDDALTRERARRASVAAYLPKR